MKRTISFPFMMSTVTVSTSPPTNQGSLKSFLMKLAQYWQREEATLEWWRPLNFKQLELPPLIPRWLRLTDHPRHPLCRLQITPQFRQLHPNRLPILHQNLQASIPVHFRHQCLQNDPQTVLPSLQYRRFLQRVLFLAQCLQLARRRSQVDHRLKTLRNFQQ